MVASTRSSDQPKCWGQRVQRTLARGSRLIGATLAAGALVAVVGATGSAVVPESSPVAAPTASAAVINLKIVNTGSRSLGICENWKYPSGQWTAKTCKDSPTDTLSKNEKSKWKDTDAIRVDKGYRVKERIAYTIKGETIYEYVNVTTCTHKEKYYLKVQPTVQRHTRYFYHKKC